MRVVIGVVLCVVAVLLIVRVKPEAPNAPAAQLHQMTQDEFKVRVLSHWFPAETRDDPPEDVQALLGLKRGDELGDGWKVRAIRMGRNAIRIELVRPDALFVTEVQLGVQLGTVAQTERYSLSATNERPGPQFFANIDLQKPVEAVAVRIRKNETQVPVPKGLTPIPAMPTGLPGTVIPAPSAPGAPSDAGAD